MPHATHAAAGEINLRSTTTDGFFVPYNNKLKRHGRFDRGRVNVCHFLPSVQFPFQSFSTFSSSPSKNSHYYQEMNSNLQHMTRQRCSHTSVLMSKRLNPGHRERPAAFRHGPIKPIQQLIKAFWITG